MPNCLLVFAESADMGLFIFTGRETQGFCRCQNSSQFPIHCHFKWGLWLMPVKSTQQQGLCCTVCDCTCFLLPSNGTLVTE